MCERYYKKHITLSTQVSHMNFKNLMVWLGQPNYTDATNASAVWFLGKNKENYVTLNVAHSSRRLQTKLDSDAFVPFLSDGLNQQQPSAQMKNIGDSGQMRFEQDAKGFSIAIVYTPSDSVPRNFSVTYVVENLPAISVMLSAQEAQCMLDWLKSDGDYNGLKLPDNLFSSISVSNGVAPDVWTFYYDKTVPSGGIGISLYGGAADFFNFPFSPSNITTLAGYLENPVATGIDCVFQFDDITWTWSYNSNIQEKFSFAVQKEGERSYFRMLADEDIQDLFNWLNSVTSIG